MYSVLLVEDEKIELETLKNFVNWEKLGIEKVYTARGGRSALECVAANEPDIVITDIQMPGMTGTELARIIREEGYGCKIVFLTGYDRFEYAKTAIQVGAEDYLLKPFQVEEVEQLVSRILEKIRQERRSQEDARIAMGRMIANACFGKLKDAETAAKMYFQKGGIETRFSLVGFYGLAADQADQLVSLPETLCGFRKEDLFITVFPGTLPVEGLLDRLAERGSNASRTVRCGETVPFSQLQHACEQLVRYQDELFFAPAGTRLVADRDSVCTNAGMPDQAGKDSIVLEAIQSGEEKRALQALREYLLAQRPLGKQGCIRQAYDLYRSIRDKMPQEERDPAKEQELADHILSSDTLEALEAGMAGFVQACCGLYQRDHGDYLENWVRHYVSSHYMEPCTAEEMAEQLRMSPNYLRKKFKEATGQTLLEYLTDVRLTMAAQLLKHRATKVKEVSLQVGYENFSYFTHIFTKKYGVTPNEYKKMVQ